MNNKKVPYCARRQVGMVDRIKLLTTGREYYLTAEYITCLNLPSEVLISREKEGA